MWDIRGRAHGLLTSHPVTPFISVHHLEAVDPFYPGLKLFTKAMRIDPRSFLQTAICYDRSGRLTFSISTGYIVQVFPSIVYPRDLEPSELTYSAWNRIHHRNEFDLDIKDPINSICKKPVLSFLKDKRRDENATLGYYAQHKESNDARRTVFCENEVSGCSGKMEVLSSANAGAAHFSSGYHFVNNLSNVTLT
ncbi:hypothetical protein SAY86_021671 [Trapa natans]|uniref:Uncharacterized protein n=1 Tax=Trapa natans TaxID=22666 RepID=A0AAN7RD84_TRANT|nr:hypothetical protein SAY86_021671 [Trapa natans]